MAISHIAAPRDAAARAAPLPAPSWLAPVAAALVYPALLRAAYAALDQPAGGLQWADRCGDLCLFALAIAGAYAVPILALWQALRASAQPHDLLVARRLSRITHLAFAAPPLYTLLGVVTALLHIGGLDVVAWTVLWGAVAVHSLRRPQECETTAPGTELPVLRSFHGIVALTVILMFLTAHLANHVLALWTPQLHERVMRTLELWYRDRVVEPALVALMVCLVLSGLTLAWQRIGSRPQDGFRTLQTLTGTYLAAFIVSHLCAVFLLARWEQHISTDWAWASGAPAGILGDPWNIRLLPHYSIAVWAAITHAGLGARQVLRAHGVAGQRADRVAFGMSALGAVASLLISCALIGLHLGEISL
jgi:hypothetical protein